MPARPLIAVIGSGAPDAVRDSLAEQIGAVIAAAGCGLVCGGLGGVMEAACRGAGAAPGGDGTPIPIVGILPGTDKSAANRHVNLVIPTGLGYARNLLVVLAADAVIAVGGESGTLSEMAHAWQLGKPVCALTGAGGWAATLAGQSLDGKRTDAVFEAATPSDAAAWLRAVLRERDLSS